MYDIIAIGNALLDTEFQITDETLTATGLTRGNMTLADLDAQNELFATLSQTGNQIAKQAGGGSAANSMVAFASLGGQAFYQCRVGDDDKGKFYLNDLKASGVSTDAAFAIDHDGTTGSCVVLVTPDGERTMQTHLGTSSQINQDNIKFDTLKNASWLYLEGYLAMSPSITTGIMQLRQLAKENGIKVAVSFADPAVVKFAKSGLDEMLLGGVDAIFCNLEEAKTYTGTTCQESAIKSLGKLAGLVVITNGSEPTLIANQGDVISVPSMTIDKVVDTNGAGDNYAGAFLYALTRNHAPDLCGQLAAHVAASVVAQFGPRLTSQEYQAIKMKVLG
ncbi:adenosine kinase [Moraxella sp. Tifton1]|uniref:adenosine kinase n=1 Tax=Moraxella oculi TaxID=2940516 RepID=UPI002012F23B|nr:adenosine kinase [Moraxella sp. Tifton1]MCL1623460.1 adenosine kinase [Moraxella sp. Tifton1]